MQHFTGTLSFLGEAQRALLLRCFPALLEFAPEEREEIMRQAGATDFDRAERGWMLVGLGVVTYLLRVDDQHAVEYSLPLHYLVQFLTALPLLAIFAGPVYLRRLRRGLKHEIERRRLAADNHDV